VGGSRGPSFGQVKILLDAGDEALPEDDRPALSSRCTLVGFLLPHPSSKSGAGMVRYRLRVGVTLRVYSDR
ncbi:MAG TPA: hypothetical protein PLV87_07585, partial [Opitutaceae bacterium]|nr:hypothetical protein [Opitutaceae bacterium]